MSGKYFLRPALEGDFWLIGPNPDLLELESNHDVTTINTEHPQHQCVDHHIFQSADGTWHLWGCIRGTSIGRILYHWEGEDLQAEYWKQTGEIIRANEKAGESIDDWDNQEWIQSPFFVKEKNIYFMFYGGHGTGLNAKEEKVSYRSESMEGQICLMTSEDGRKWTRHRNSDGHSRLFIGPGETRDPSLIMVDGLWHMYYAGYHNEDREQPGIYVRASNNLINWSPWKLVHQDFRYGEGKWAHECPHVVYRGGYFYLFRTKSYSTAETFVFRSENPYDFGIGNAENQFVGNIPVAAPEIIIDTAGNEYITSNHDLRAGTKLCKLRWITD